MKRLSFVIFSFAALGTLSGSAFGLESTVATTCTSRVIFSGRGCFNPWGPSKIAGYDPAFQEALNILQSVPTTNEKILVSPVLRSAISEHRLKMLEQNPSSDPSDFSVIQDFVSVRAGSGN
jgi:hypothetical protein